MASIRAYLPLAVLAPAIVALLLGATVASAQEPPITVSTNSPLPLLVDGLETQGLPASVQAGSRVCVEKALHYVGLSERWVFQGWSHGTTSQCVTLTEPGAYRALYDHEVLLLIRSTVSAVQESRWVLHGSPVQVEVPETVEEEGGRVRFRFQEWSEGETPFSPTNVIAPLTPMTLEATWVKEYLVTVEGPPDIQPLGSGWYPEGSSLVLQAPDVVEGENEGERLKFVSWESVGLPVLVTEGAQQPVLTINADAPYSLRATYEKQYLVVALAPFGTLKREWLKEGGEVVLEAPPIQEVIPEQLRLVFQRWEGQEGLISPRISGVVDAPVSLTAVYQRQVMVTVDAPYGSAGGGWHPVGSTVAVSVPDHIQEKLIFRKSFVGFAGYARERSTIQVLADQPTVITALYRSEVNVGVLSLLLLLPLAAVLIYFANRWVMLLVRRRGRREEALEEGR